MHRVVLLKSAMVIDAVRAAFAEPDGLLPQNGGPQPHFDLPEANRRNLAAAGVRAIELSDYCTACRTDLFFSHRAERAGRDASGQYLRWKCRAESNLPVKKPALQR